MRRILITVLALGALALPAAALAAGAQQIVERYVDVPTLWELDDPCNGTALHGEGPESGVLRVTELGDKGYHLRASANGAVDLYDDNDDFVGTWTYVTNFQDQYPPDGQGAAKGLAVGPLQYEDGHIAIIQIHLHAVFEKGDIVKREFFKAVCGGAQ